MGLETDLPIRVLLFARYAELLGRDHVDLRLQPGATVGDAVGEVRRLPGGSVLPGRVLVARRLEQVDYAERLEVHDELALLPPMSGG